MELNQSQSNLLVLGLILILFFGGTTESAGTGTGTDADAEPDMGRANYEQLVERLKSIHPDSAHQTILEVKQTAAETPSLITPLAQKENGYRNGYTVTYNFTSVDFNEHIANQFPAHNVVLALDITQYVEERKMPLFVQTLIRSQPNMIIMTLSTPLENDIFLNNVHASRTPLPIDKEGIQKNQIYQYYRSHFCTVQYDINIIRTNQLRSMLSQYLFDNDIYNSYMYKIVVIEPISIIPQYNQFSLSYLTLIDPVVHPYYHTSSTAEQLLINTYHHEYVSMVQSVTMDVLQSQYHSRNRIEPCSYYTSINTSFSCPIPQLTSWSSIQTLCLKYDNLNWIQKKYLYSKLFEYKYYDVLGTYLYEDMTSGITQIRSYKCIKESYEYVKLFIHPFLSLFFYYLSSPQFILSRRLQFQYLFKLGKYLNLLRISEMSNSCAYMNDYRTLPIFNVLYLYNPLCNYWLPPAELYSRDVLLTTHWFAGMITYGLEGGVSHNSSYVWLRRLVSSIDFRHQQLAGSPLSRKYSYVIDQETGYLLLGAPAMYFATSYIDPIADRHIKRVINEQMKSMLQDQMISWNSHSSIPIPLLNNKPRLGVVTRFWNGAHASVRILRATVGALKDAFHVTLIMFTDEMMGQINSEQVEWKEYIHDVIFLPTSPIDLFINTVNNNITNQYAILYYLDVGMYAYSTFLANKRLARIQIASYGHSVSTYGSEIDYWIGGEETELLSGYIKPQSDGNFVSDHVINGKVRLPNYSETLILVPGLGVVHDKPNYIPTTPRNLTYPSADEPFIINLGWSLPKVNAGNLANLKSIQTRVGQKRKILFRFFLGEPYTTELTVFKSILEVLGPDNVEAAPRSMAGNYLSQFQLGHLLLDSHHHGSCNTVVDAFVTHTPMVMYEGFKWNNRIGPAMLRRANMSEYIAYDDEQFVQLAVRLIEDSSYWNFSIQRLFSLDLDELFFTWREAHYYRAAFVYLFRSHEQLQADGFPFVNLKIGTATNETKKQ